MEEFKLGDLVICILPDDSFKLTWGNIYTIRYILTPSDELILKEIPGHSWRRDRFKRVKIYPNTKLFQKLYPNGIVKNGLIYVS